MIEATEIWEKVVSQMRERLFWAKLEGDEVARLSIEFFIAQAMEDLDKMIQLRDRARRLIPADYQKFWTYAADIAEQIVSEELGVDLNEQQGK